MNPEQEYDQCESDADGFPVGSPHSPVLEDPDCDGCREEFGAPSNCTHCPYRNHPKAKPTLSPTKLDFSELSETKIAKMERERSRSGGAILVDYANEEPTSDIMLPTDPRAVTRPPLVKETGSFCPYCGHDIDWSKPTAPLSVALPCGHEGPDDAKFCPDCGVTIEYDCEGEDCNTPECDPGPWCSGFKPIENIDKANKSLEEALSNLHVGMGNAERNEARRDIMKARDLLGNIKIEPNRGDGPKSSCCGVATVWINARQRYICPNCGNYPSEKPAEEPERVGKGTSWDTGDARVNELLDQGCELGEALDQAAKDRKKEDE